MHRGKSQTEAKQKAQAKSVYVEGTIAKTTSNSIFLRQNGEERLTVLLWIQRATPKRGLAGQSRVATGVEPRHSQPWGIRTVKQQMIPRLAVRTKHSNS